MTNSVRIIEEISDETVTKILLISFDLSIDLKLLFTPRLENITFIKVDNTITVNLKNPDFRDFFNDWVQRLISKINVKDEGEIIIENFNKEIKTLILLGKKENKISWETARGLYGEFLVIHKYLLENKFTQLEIIEGWHRPAPANHDFDYNEYSLEVKTVSRDSTTVKITSQFQLESFEGKPLKLYCFRIEKIEKSNVDSLGDLFNQIKILLTPTALNLFETKCCEDIFCEYLGPELMPLDYKFTLLEDNLYIVDQINFPRVKRQDLNPAISKFSYSLDISSLVRFKININGY
jgi:hypothetical protein